ncbi:TolC family protein [Desulfurella sp.]|uniref:TolC family protein n=1 Tax=Desulfurella sp. TaxID=1962857 RepID=UPI003D0F79DA
MKVSIFICLVLFLIPYDCKAKTITLEQLQQLIQKDPNIEIAQKEYNIAKSQVDINESALSPTLFSSVTYTNYSNPVQTSTYNVSTTNQNGLTNNYSETLTPQQQRYNNISANIGLSIPLFGSHQNLKRDLIVSKSILNQNSTNIELQKWQAIKSLIYAYSEYYVRSIQIDLAKGFLHDESLVKDILLKRQKAGLILDSDRLELNTEFGAVKRNEFVYLKQSHDALNTLQLLTGKTLNNIELAYPYLNTDFITKQVLIESMYKNPQIKLYTEKLEGYKKALSETGSIFSSGSLSVSTGVQNSFQGGMGWNVSATLNIGMPLLEKKWYDATYSKAFLEMQKAELELENQKKAFKNACSSYYLQFYSRKENLEFAKERLNAALVSYNTAKLRKPINPGDYFYNVVKSKYYLYQTANDYLEALLEYFKAQADLLGLIGYDDIMYKKDAINDKNEGIISNIKSVFNVPKINYQNGAYLSWYLWNGLSWYKKLGENFWDKIPKSTKRIFLSLNSQEIQLVRSNQKDADVLIKFIKQAKQRDIKVELLLGDPYWVLSKYRTNLINIIKNLQRFPFDGIQLDIEKSQLPLKDRHLWENGIVKIISEVKKNTSLPIGLSMNYMEAENKILLNELKKAGLNEVILMIYTTNTKRIIEISDNIIKQNPNLYFSIALSCEPTSVLPQYNTFAQFGANNSLLKWEDLYKYFSTIDNFLGITIQSLEDFWNLKNEN